MALSHTILVFFNVLAFLIGAAMFAIAVYFYASPQYSFLFQASVNVRIIWIAGGAGIALAFISFLGCVVSYKEHKGILCLYTFLVVCILAAQIAGAYFIGIYMGILTTGASSSTTVVVESDLNAGINNAILSVYYACCVGCSSVTCNPTTTAGTNLTATTYTSVNCPGNNCAGVNQYCFQNNNLSPCWDNSTDVPTVISGVSLPIPYFDLGATATEVCKFFSTEAALNSTTTVELVGVFSTGSCGGGVPQKFLEEFYTYAASKSTYAYGVAGAIAAVECILIISALFTLCEKSPGK